MVMSLRRSTVWVLLASGLVAALLLAAASPIPPVHAQAKKLKIGVIFDYTGPLAGGGSDLHALGAKIMIDHFAKKGGVEGYKIEAVYADAQSKPEIAINEAVRLIEQEKVDMLLGFYSSAQCVPVAGRVEQLQKFMWITTCISSAVLENRNLKYVFRIQPSGRQFGLMSTDFISQNAKAKLGKEPKDLRVAIIHEDGAYGVDVSKGNEEGAKKAGFNVVLKEGYAATAPDLASLVTKLKRARPDVIFHTGYNPDISLFLRQARELGLRFNALVGHGAGYGVYDKLKEALGKDVNYFYNVDPISIWLANEKALRPELVPLIKMVVLMGVDARRIYLITSALGGGLAGLAACLLVLQYDVHPFVGLSFGPITFLICVLGGLGNFGGGFVAAFVFAELISLGGLYLDLEWGYVFAFVFFIVMMFVRPAGLLARRS
jgi:branched-chain amino acid transport system substrate-binding protein